MQLRMTAEHFRLLPSAFCPLPSALCPLPSPFCLLPSAFCLLPSAFAFAFCLHPSRPHPLPSSPLATHYAFEPGDDEHRRLIALANAEAGHVVEACARAGVGRGATVLDLGCGPLGAVAALAGVVGESGMVVGVDVSEAALQRARAMMPVREFPSVRFVQSDVHALTPDMLGVRADLAYCRLFLLHQSDPAVTLRHAATFLRKGGALVAHDASDLPIGAPASEPHVPAMTRVWELVIAAAHARGATTDFGRRGRHYLEAAGLRVESSRAYTVHYPPAVGYEIPRVALHSMQPTLLGCGLSDEDEIAQLDRDLQEAKTSTGVAWVSSPAMFEWIGRKD
jgi:SAM-dependent methyltransferase